MSERPDLFVVDDLYDPQVARTIERRLVLSAMDDFMRDMVSKDHDLAWKNGRSPDRFAPRQEEIALMATATAIWDSRLRTAVKLIHIPFAPDASIVDPIVTMLRTHLSGPALTRPLVATLNQTLVSSFDRGKQSVDHNFKTQAGRAPARKDAHALFGVLLGLTEDHALQALSNQFMIAAGGFWDDRMQMSIKREMTSWFSGSLTRDELVDKLTTLVNERLMTSGKSLARSYFDNLATHIINRSRNVGSVYRGKSLGVKHYRIGNPRDARTSEICRALSNGQVFEFAEAESAVADLLRCRTTAELKEKVPFLTPETAKTTKNPMPPCHFGGCRDWMEMIFPGLN